MKFGRYLHYFSCLLILIGFLSIFITGSYQWIVALGVLTTLMYAFLPRLFHVTERIPTQIWNGLVLIILAYLIYDSFWGSLDLVGNAISFVILLQIIKLSSTKTNRDWLQIYALSFLHIISSTVISDNLTFALPFILYLFVATWTLSLFNTKAQFELATKHNPNEVKGLLDSRKIVGRSFFGGTAALCSIMLVVTFLLFFMIPRVSFKHFLRRTSKQQDIQGFSSEVELGSIGSIKENPNIAFRVEMDLKLINSINLDNLYWRGTSADHFDGKKWSQTMRDKKRVSLNFDDAVLETRAKPMPGQKRIQYSVFLESLSTPVIFGADRLLRFVWKKPFIERFLRRVFFIVRSDAYGSVELINQQQYVSDLSYEGESVLGRPRSAILLKETQNYPQSIKEKYLQLPKLDPKLVELFDGFTFSNATPFEKALWLQQYLVKNYRYTLDVQDLDQADPLKFFFLNSKKGHCEYFSTAFIIALRYIGIPARQVMGFRGGEFNPYGEYIAIRQANAHSWVEVYFPKSGWVRFDPTPPDRNISFNLEFLQPMYQMIDYIRLRWNKYIIEYDLKSQVEWATKIGKKVSGLVAFKSRNRKSFEEDEDLQSQAAPRGRRIKIIAASLLGLFLLWLVLRFRPKRRIKSAYDPVLAVLDRQGYTKATGETVLELQERVSQKHPKWAESLQSINKLYYAFRFGRNKKPLEQWKKMLREIKDRFR